MRQFISVTVLAAAAAMACLTVSVPVQAQYAHCMPARGCVPATQATYNACYQLARRLGWNDSDNSDGRTGLYRALDGFIFRCLAGRIRS